MATLPGLQSLIAGDESLPQQGLPTSTPPFTTVTLPSLSQPQAQPAQKQGEYNTDIVPQSFIDLEKRLSKGSEVSPLQHILAWVGAAKGDFRGLVALDEAKRQTALGKALAPEMRKISELVNNGKFKEASEYINTVSGAVGPRAKEFVPFLNSIAENIRTKEGNYIEVKNMVRVLDNSVEPNSVNRKIVDELKKSLDSHEVMSKEGVNAILVRLAPHIQQLGDNRLVSTQPLTGATSVQQFPAVVTGADTSDFTSTALAPIHNINTKQLSDVLNNVPVQTPDGKQILPNSQQSQLIKSQYNALQPLKSNLELISALKLAPADALQAIKSTPAFSELRKVISASDIDTIINEQLERQTKQQIAIETGKIEGNPLAPKQAGYITIGTRPGQEGFLIEQSPMSYAQAKQSGNFDFIRPEVFDKEVKPAYAGVQSLQLIPQLLAGNDLTTRGDRVAAGINQAVSAIIGYPLSDEVEVRQAAKAILMSAVEQAENVSGHDRKEIGDLKKFIAGDFKTPSEMIEAAKYIQTRLEMVIQRAVQLKSPLNRYSEPIQPAQSTQPRAPVTNDQGIQLPTTIGEPTVPLPKALLDAIKKKEAESAASQTTQPSLPPPSLAEPPAPLSAVDRVKKAWSTGGRKGVVK